MLRPEYPVFVLTLPGAEGRRRQLVRSLTDLGIEHELFFGVDGRNGLPPEAEAMVDREEALRVNWRHLSDAEYACALSHLAAQAEIGKRGLPGAVILEDDALIGEPFRRFIEAGAWRCAAMVLLDHGNTLVTRHPPRPIIEGVVGYRIAVPPYRSTGYALSARAAGTIRRRSLPLRYHADWTCNIARLQCLAAMPRLVTPEPTVSSVSNLSPTRAPAQQVWVRPRVSLLREIRDLDGMFYRLGRRMGRPLE